MRASFRCKLEALLRNAALMNRSYDRLGSMIEQALAAPFQVTQCTQCFQGGGYVSFQRNECTECFQGATVVLKMFASDLTTAGEFR